VGGVFINYRGEDSQTAAALIDRELTALFGDDQVFLDSRSIPAGVNFVEELRERLRACSVLLVVIGPRWLTLTDAVGRRRIDNPQDWIRQEIAEALAHGLRVIPVLIGNSALPAEADLPQDIAALSHRQHIPLRRRYTSVDLAFLAERIIMADPELGEVAGRRHSSTERVPQRLSAAVTHFTGWVGELTGRKPGHGQGDVAMPDERWDFFVSYTESDRPWAEWIAWQLESEGYRVLVQAWDFVPGSRWTMKMDEGVSDAARTIVILSSAYLRSIYGQSEWAAALREDPTEFYQKLITIRVEDTPLPAALLQAVGLDVFGVPESVARSLMLENIAAALAGQTRPSAHPAFPGTPRDRGVVDPSSVGAAEPPTEPRGPLFPDPSIATRPPIREVGEVFQPTGIPEITFVQQKHFIPFRMTLRQPGLSIVLECPSGLGKTTLLTHAIEQDRERFGEPKIYSARIEEHRDEIDRLVVDGHEGVVAIDDYHRLSMEQQRNVVDYLKQLADSGSRSSKIVIVGIPGTARSLVKISPDIANRIRVFRPKAATQAELLALIDLGEKALNIEFEDKASIAAAASGSLITAQALLGIS